MITIKKCNFDIKYFRKLEFINKFQIMRFNYSNFKFLIFIKK